MAQLRYSSRITNTLLCLDIFLIISSCIAYQRMQGAIPDVHANLSSEDIIRGLGVFLNITGLIKYMEWRQEFYMLVLAVKASLGRVVITLGTLVSLRLLDTG